MFELVAIYGGLQEKTSHWGIVDFSSMTMAHLQGIT